MSRLCKLASFDQDLLAHPWWVLVKEICDEVPSDVMKELIFTSKEHLGGSFPEIYDNCDGLQFFHVLEKKLGIDKVAEYVKNLLSHSDLHDGTGCNKLSRWVEDYKNQLENYRLCCLQNGIPRECRNFVGRQEILKRILEILRVSDHRGVFIHGSEGMGKTTLAEEVCCNMKFGDERFNVFVLDLRGKKTIIDLLHEFLTQLCVGSFETSGAALKQLVYKAVREKNFQSRNIFLWDSVDDILENDQTELMDFLEQLLNTMVTMHADCKTRLLLTCRIELPKALPSLFSIGLKALSQQDSKDLLRRLVLPNVDDALLSSVANYCGGCPLALRIASCSILNISLENLRQTPEIKFLINHLLSKLFTSLDQPRKEKLVKLSIFESSLFDYKTIIKILEAEKEDEVKEFLQWMIDKYLIEVKDKNFASRTNYSLKTLHSSKSIRGSMDRSFERTHSLSSANSRSSFESSTDSFDVPSDDIFDSYVDHEYSFHPYISCFLKEQSKTNVFRDCVQNARIQFLKHFISVLSNCGNINVTSPLDCMKLLAKHKIHVKIFYKLLNEEKQSVGDFLSEKMSKSRQQHLSNISVLSELVLSVDNRKHYFQREAIKSMEKQDFSQYIQWKCEEVEANLEEGKCDEAEKIIDDVSHHHLHKMKTVRTDTSSGDNQANRVHVVAWFHYVKARYLLHKRHKSVDKDRYENALSELQIARHLYEGNFSTCIYYRDWFEKKSAKNMKSFISSHASVLNMMGHVCFLKGDFEQSIEDRKKALKEAKKYHEKALEVLQETKDPLCASVYQTNIAACLHKLISVTENDKKKKLCKKALSWYNDSVDGSRRLHQDFNIGYADTLRNRSDIYRLKSKLDGENKQDCLTKAVNDAAESLKIKEILLTPHDINLIRSAYDLAVVSKLLALDCDDENLYSKALENYEKVLELIWAKGFPWIDTRDKLYRQIKAGHRRILEKMKCPWKMEKARKVYEEIESKSHNTSEQNMDLPCNHIPKLASIINDAVEVQDTSVQEGSEQMLEVRKDIVNLQPSHENEVIYTRHDSKVKIDKEESLMLSKSEEYLCVEMKPQQDSEMKDERIYQFFETSISDDQEIKAYESRSQLPLTNSAADISAEPVHRREVRRSLKRQISFESENFDEHS